jgi:hypothetical protein
VVQDLAKRINRMRSPDGKRGRLLAELVRHRMRAHKDGVPAMIIQLWGVLWRHKTVVNLSLMMSVGGGDVDCLGSA